MPCYRFGPFSLDPEKRMLRRHEEPLPITGKTFDTLLTLIESRGRVVLKEELLERVWAGARTEEGSLTQSVFTARRVLGDSAKEQRYIATIAGRGYQFVSPVYETEDATRSKVAHSKWRPGPSTLAVTAGLICAGFIAYHLASSPSVPLVTGYKQVTADGAEKSLLGIGGNNIFLKEGYSTRRLALPTGPEQTVAAEGQEILDVSADGKSLLGQTRFVGPLVESQLWRVPFLGGQPQVLGHAAGHAAAWSRDGKRLIYVQGTSLYLANDDGSNPKQVADLPGIARDFSWSPDDRLVRFDLMKPGYISRTLWQIDTRDRQVVPLIDPNNGFADACCGRWTADGAYFVFESRGQLWTVDEKRPKSKPVQLTFSPMRLSTPIPGREPNQLFAVGKVLRGELLQYDVTSHKWDKFLNGISAEFVDVSADDQWITYVSFPEGVLWRSKSDGTERLSLTAAPLHAFEPKWSSDGRRIVFSDRGDQRFSKLYLVEASGKGLHPLAVEDTESQVDGNLTPDGKSVLFGNDFTAANPALHLMDLQTTKIATVPGSFGLFSPRLSRSGRYLLAMPMDSRKIVVYDFQSREWETLAEGTFGSPAWSPDEKFVYTGASYNGRAALVRIRVQDRSVQLIGYEGNFQPTGSIGFWFGLGPKQSILALHDTGIKDVYLLDWPRH